MISLSNLHALLIGVGDYAHPRFASLPATVRDAKAVAAIVTDPAGCSYPRANVQVLTGEQATAANIRAALKTLAKSTNPESTAFIYFSGHGGRTLENGRWQAYLCPREADPDDLPGTAISGVEFSNVLATIPARKMLVVLDACHAGGAAELKAADGTVVWKSGLPNSYYEALAQGGGRVVIASSKEEQFSYVRSQGDLSLFTWHLLEGLEGAAAVYADGFVRVLDLYYHVSQQVKSEQPNQEPVLHAKDVDDNFPIALAHGGVAVKRPSPALEAIHEQIVHNPIAGARALSHYLATRPEWTAKRAEVDLKRADLERIEHDLELFGPSENDKAAKNRVVYFLLRVCLELEDAVSSKS